MAGKEFVTTFPNAVTTIKKRPVTSDVTDPADAQISWYGLRKSKHVVVGEHPLPRLPPRLAHAFDPKNLSLEAKNPSPLARTDAIR